MSKMYEALKKFHSEGGDSQHGELTMEESEPVAENVMSATLPAAKEAVAVELGKPTSENTGPRQLSIEPTPECGVVSWDGTDRHASEHYRIVRTRIVQHPKSPRIIIISSAGPGDGKTVTAINVAGMLSLRDNANVLLIDGDFRRSTIATRLGLPAEPGLANTLDGSSSLQESIIRIEQFPNLYVLTAGKSAKNPAELLDSDRWRSLCATVRERFSFVIIDSPPIAAVADYELMQASCDGVIVVIRPGHTDRTLCDKTFEMIPEKKRLGAVLNCASEWFLWKTQESYYYGSNRQ